MKWLALLVAILLPLPAFAAIAFDTSTLVTSAANMTWTQTDTGSNITDFVCGQTGNNGVYVSAVTDNGTSMIKLGQLTMTSGNGGTTLFYLPGQSGGTHTFIATNPTGSDAISADYTGTASAIDNNSVNASSTNATKFGMTIAATSTAAWAVFCTGNGNGSATGVSNVTIRQTTPAYAFAFGDSNGSFSGSLSQVESTGAAAQWNGIQATLAPSGSAPTATPVLRRRLSWW